MNECSEVQASQDSAYVSWLWDINGLMSLCAVNEGEAVKPHGEGCLFDSRGDEGGQGRDELGLMTGRAGGSIAALSASGPPSHGFVGRPRELVRHQDRRPAGHRQIRQAAMGAGADGRALLSRGTRPSSVDLYVRAKQREIVQREPVQGKHNPSPTRIVGDRLLTELGQPRA